MLNDWFNMKGSRGDGRRTVYQGIVKVDEVQDKVRDEVLQQKRLLGQDS